MISKNIVALLERKFNDREGDTGESHVVCIYDSSSCRGFNNASFSDQTRVRKVKLGFDSGYAEDSGVERRSDFMVVIGRRGRDIKCNREFFSTTSYPSPEPNRPDRRTLFLKRRRTAIQFPRSKQESYLAWIVTGTRIDYGDPGRL